MRVHAAGFTPGELDWPGTWTDRAGRDRTPSVPGHELSGVVTELGYGTTGLTVGRRVFGLADWTRDGSLAEYTAVEARNLAPVALAALPDGDSLSFTRLQDLLGLTPGNLIIQLRKLEEAGYLSSEKTRNGSAQKTTVALTRQGRKALDAYTQALRDLLGGL